MIVVGSILMNNGFCPTISFLEVDICHKRLRGEFYCCLKSSVPRKEVPRPDGKSAFYEEDICVTEYAQWQEAPFLCTSDDGFFTAQDQSRTGSCLEAIRVPLQSS